MLADRKDLVVLEALGAKDARLIGQGGEAKVYALNERQVLRLLRSGASLAVELDRAELLSEIAAGRHAVSFTTPDVERVMEIDGRVAVIERRLVGISLAQALDVAQGEERELLVQGYLDAASQVGDIAVKRDFFGDLASAQAVRRPSYRQYLHARLERSRLHPGALQHLPSETIGGIPDCRLGELVHFDLFPGNVLVDAGRVTAVIDFGATSMIADRKLDCWAAVAYLDPELSPEATAGDRALAMQWLDERGLSANFPAVKRWIASYWCLTDDDPKLRAWCSRVLSQSGAA